MIAIIYVWINEHYETEDLVWVSKQARNEDIYHS